MIIDRISPTPSWNVAPCTTASAPLDLICCAIVSKSVVSVGYTFEKAVLIPSGFIFARIPSITGCVKGSLSVG